VLEAGTKQKEQTQISDLRVQKAESTPTVEKSSQSSESEINLFILQDLAPLVGEESLF